MSENNEPPLDLVESRRSFLSRTQPSTGYHQDHDLTTLKPDFDLSPATKEALYDNKKRLALQRETCDIVHVLCKVCVSPWFPIYTEWLAMDGYSAPKCSALARECFSEEISDQSFARHKKNHMKDTFLVRRIMVMKDPNIQPEKIISATIKVLQQQIMENERLDPKLLSELRNFLDLHGKYTGVTKELPQTVITNQSLTINSGGAIPNAQDTKDLLSRTLSQEERDRLEYLTKMLQGRGSSAARAMIPENVPEVKSPEVKNVKEPWEDGDQ